jgi:hypothetical protein
LIKPITKRAGGVAQGVGPEFKPQYCHAKKKTKKKVSVHQFSPVLSTGFHYLFIYWWYWVSTLGRHVTV